MIFSIALFGKQVDQYLIYTIGLPEFAFKDIDSRARDDRGCIYMSSYFSSLYTWYHLYQVMKGRSHLDESNFGVLHIE